MSLIPTRVVDKNGRATTVHKRSGSSAVNGKSLSSAKPTVSTASKAKIDQPYAHPVDNGFPVSRFGIVLNEMRPHLALKIEDLQKHKKKITVTTRGIYSWVRRGFSARDGIYLSYFQITPDEAGQIINRLEAMGQGRQKLYPKPWVDNMFAADIDHEAMLSAIENGLTHHDLDEMPPENAPSAILAYGYKGFSKTELAAKVRDGKVSWDDIKSIGVSRATKHEWIITNAMSDYAQVGPHALDYVTLGEIIRDAEKRPRLGYDGGPVPAESTIGLHTRFYRMIGPKFWELNMPETIDRVERLAGTEDDLVGYVMYCDETMHKVRSEPGILEAVINTRGRSRNHAGGSYVGQYPDQRDSDWNFKELVDFRDAGLTVDQCVYALTKGLTPERAKGMFSEGIPLAVNDGWL